MIPTTVDRISTLREALAPIRQRGGSIGFVPTMGALHRGHTSLLDLARTANAFVVASIFVNPTQFGPNEDFSRYPRQMEQDLALCESAGVDLVFTPSPEEMYPRGSGTFVEVTGLTDGLCGASRPGHFRGVATVVLKLLNVVQPQRAYFGQKDAQQVRVIQQLVRDLNVPVEIVVGPTVREADGLALSSRNQYLDAGQRGAATVLYQALQEANNQIESGARDGAAVQRTMAERIASTPGAVIDYVEIVDRESLQPLAKLRGTILVAVAVKFGATRLIDNLLIEVAS